MNEHLALSRAELSLGPLLQSLKAAGATIGWAFTMPLLCNQALTSGKTLDPATIRRFARDCDALHPLDRREGLARVG